jgi:hypothetical protein
MTCGGTLTFRSLNHKVQNRGCAGSMLMFLGVLVLGALLAHFLGVVLWRSLPWTKEKPLPDCLVFPVPELLLAGLLVMPLGMACTLLLMQLGEPGSQVLGALGMALLLAYLWLVGAVLAGVSARQELLGLRYVEHAKPSSAAQGPAIESKPSSATTISVQRSIVLDDSAAALGSDGTNSLLLRVTPPHSAGHWQRPDVVLQQELRRTYQSEWLHQARCGYIRPWACMHQIDS